MTKRLYLFFVFIIYTCFSVSAQKFSRTLLKGDKFYIKQAYKNAIPFYEKYLKKHPRDYYASRQAAICYSRLNNPAMAIDYWPAVIESSEANDKDLFDYSKCLLANYRKEEAAKILVMLSKSKDPVVSDWANAYTNPTAFFADSALCKVTEVSGVNTAAHEHCPVVLKDRVFFLSDALKNIRVFSALTDEKLVSISSSFIRDSINFYSNVLFSEFKARNINGQFCFSPDGETIYFSMAVYSKDLGVKTKYPFCRFQLYTANMHGPTEVKGFKHNSPDFDFMHPSLSKDGNHLYFSSDRSGTLGGKDIFVCDLVNGEWSEPKNLGTSVNTSGNEVFPHISGEGVLYFVSDELPGIGGLDIFYSKPGENGFFQKARNAGAYINSQFDDFGIFVLPGGKTGYLSSNRKNNTDDDIYFFRNEKPQ